MNYFSLAKKLGLHKDVKPSNELVKASEFLKINAEEVIIKARLAMFASMIASAIGLGLTGNASLLVLAVLPGLIAYYYFTERPKNQAKEERQRHLGMAPEIITILGTSLELNPNLERAVRLVGESNNGRISQDFGNAYKQSILKGIPLRNSFNEIIKEWGEYSDGFKQGTHLLNASLLEREGRQSTINNGMNAFFNGLINDLRKFLSKTKTHTLILFSFGTIIPLILISMLPVISLLNMQSNPLMISGLLIINLIIINYYSEYILKNRPSTFSQIHIKGKDAIDHLKSYSALLFFIISSPTLIYFGAELIGGSFTLLPREYSTLPLILGVSIGLSAYYYGKSKPLIKAREKAVKTEKELLTIIYGIGSKLQEKRSFEDTLKHVINEHKSKELTKYLRKAYHNIKELKINTEDSIMSELIKTGSQRVTSVFKLLFHALKRGVENSARSVFRIYEHYNRMIQAEEEHKALLEQVLSMMKITALVFAPLISSFIVIMQGMIEANITDTAGYGLSLNSGISLEVMQLILGFYNIGLVIVLTSYYVKLKNGPDKVLLRYELSKDLMISTIIYLSALIIARFILM